MSHWHITSKVLTVHCFHCWKWSNTTEYTLISILFFYAKMLRPENKIHVHSVFKIYRLFHNLTDQKNMFLAYLTMSHLLYLLVKAVLGHFCDELALAYDLCHSTKSFASCTSQDGVRTTKSTLKQPMYKLEFLVSFHISHNTIGWNCLCCPRLHTRK